MSLLVPAALAFGLIIPLILLLYFMRPKRQERIVGSTLLWRQALEDLQASRPWQRLRITPLLLLQLLAALVIILVLTRPAIFSSSPISGDTIIILQASASMQATDVAPSRFEAARSQVADLLGGLGPGDQVSLIAMATTPQVLLAASQDRDALQRALQRAHVTNQDADLAQALSLAASLAAGHTNAQVLVVGDGHVLTPDQPLTYPFPVRFMRIGTDAPNVALLALAARPVSGTLTALAQVANYGHAARAIPVELYADGKLVSVQTLNLAAGATGSLQWSPIPSTAHYLYAHLVSQDALSVDHEAWAIVGGSMHGKVLLVTKGNSFLEAALRLQTNVELFETTPDKYANADTFDLVVLDGFVPSTLPKSDLFFVNPPAGTYPFGTSGVEVGVSRIVPGNDSSSLLSNVDLSSIHTLRNSHLIKPQPWARPIIVSDQTPLLIAGEQSNRRIAALSFDLHDSDLPLQPSFPILAYNLVNWFLPPPVAGDGQVAPGAVVALQTWPGAEQVAITAPGQQQAQVLGPPFPLAPYTDTDRPGIYQVQQRVRGQERYGAFAVNLFDPLQSRLTPAAQLPVASSSDFTTSGVTVPHVLREIWPWIAALLLLILCAEWWLFSRAYRARQGASMSTNARSGKNARETTGWIPRARLALEARFKPLRKRARKRLKRIRSQVGRSATKGGRHVDI